VEQTGKSGLRSDAVLNLSPLVNPVSTYLARAHGPDSLAALGAGVC
jgi:hypothetical protein